VACVYSGSGGILAALVEIFHRDTGQLLAYCYLGEDDMVERIAPFVQPGRFKRLFG